MHRALALLLIPALMATSGMASLLHTHAYDDHDHPEHHHGLSAHEHHAPASHSGHGGARLESCDPGTHVISFAFAGAALTQGHAVDAALTLAATPRPEIQIDRKVRPTDVRVHGPPRRTQASPRAPPLIAPA